MTKPKERDDKDGEGRQLQGEGDATCKPSSPSAEASTSRLADDRSDEKQEQQVTTSEAQPAAANTDNSHPWQAVWDATRAAWYFWNAQTGETTWENPLQGQDGVDGGGEDAKAARTADAANQPNADAAAAALLSDEEVALACGIDPDLSFLDPRMYAAEIQQARARGIGGGGQGSAPTSTAAAAYTMAGAFDSRTGRFVPRAHVGPGGLHDPSRLAHAAQADRQMGAFFDVDQYHEQRKRDHDAVVSEGKVEADADGRVKRRAPTKKELKQFKERAKEKKAAKHAWLRN